ncbi:Cytochrome c6 [Aquisphaera giovannonii]|uniref:Cytochrome c6 n=1 Tax=Aquisphaera giovannonii TaxID=406548 RepID=A0A5B9WAE0_9BACT|nr:c-type cytochrome [Aquisphaera giovannonii]QEH36830.1 Cytochrome c6 [Aquisphaera giovannonii]
MRQRIPIGLTIGLLLASGAGCARQPEPRFTLSAASQKLKPEFQQQIAKILAERCGRPLAPKLVGSPSAAPAYLGRGAEIYARYCVQCHGVNGDGNGVAAAYLIPRPRNYQLGIFKFTSTTYGSKPLRDDLIRTVRRGIRGTSMPAFPLFAPKDVEAVVDYVLALTHRGELEAKLAEAAEFDEQIDEAKLPEMAAEIATRWDDAKAHVVYPATPMPTFKKANLEAGKKAFETVGCAKCHGEDGRGMMASNVGTDAWGFPTKAADLTSGMLRGGTEPLDIYRHIDSGINGTPMPSFRDTLKAQPETVWNLVSYVLHVADIRRGGAIPDSGLLEDGYLKPLPGVKLGEPGVTPPPAAAAGATHAGAAAAGVAAR